MFAAPLMDDQCGVFGAWRTKGTSVEGSGIGTPGSAQGLAASTCRSCWSKAVVTQSVPSSQKHHVRHTRERDLVGEAFVLGSIAPIPAGPDTDAQT